MRYVIQNTKYTIHYAANTQHYLRSNMPTTAKKKDEDRSPEDALNDHLKCQQLRATPIYTFFETPTIGNGGPKKQAGLLFKCKLYVLLSLLLDTNNITDVTTRSHQYGDPQHLLYQYTIGATWKSTMWRYFRR